MCDTGVFLYRLVHCAREYPGKMPGIRSSSAWSILGLVRVMNVGHCAVFLQKRALAPIRLNGSIELQQLIYSFMFLIWNPWMRHCITPCQCSARDACEYYQQKTSQQYGCGPDLHASIFKGHTKWTENIDGQTNSPSYTLHWWRFDFILWCAFTN